MSATLWQLARGVTRFRAGHGCAGARVSDDLRKQVIIRDGFTCRACKGPVAEHGDVEAWDTAATPALSDLLTVCPLCAAPLRLHAVTGRTYLIYLPDLSQAVLAHLVRAAIRANLSPETRQAAEQFMNGLSRCRDEAVRRIGTYNPQQIADVIASSPDRADEIGMRLSGVRVMINPLSLVDYAKSLSNLPG